jgi:Ca2+-binding RTX toxin-like protein
MRTTTLRFDRLEPRDVPAIIHWTNDGVNDHFGEVFGGQADEARAVVRAAIDAWETVISDFNNLNGNALDLTIRMATDEDVEDFGFGGDTDRIGGQCPPGEVELDANGRPIGALILLGRGTNGSGAGWYIDPSPDEAGEFLGTIQNAFVGGESDDSVDGDQDFYSLVLAELTHAVGLTSASGSRYRSVIDAGAAGFGGVKLTDTGVLDKNYLGATGDIPTLWAFDGPSINYLMTDADGGEKGRPVHTASPATGNSALYGGQVLRGNWNVGNAGSLNGHRYLVPNAVALMLQDVYGYSLASGGPERFGTFYTLKHSNGQVLVRGTTGGDDLAVSRNALFTTARADVAVSVPGTEPIDPFADGFVSFYANATVQATRVEAGAGNDTVTFTGPFSGLDSSRAYGATGRDRLDATAVTSGGILLDGDEENDTIYGGAGGDDLFGGPGNDQLRGYGGGDEIAAGTGNDTAYGGDGNDYLLGDLGNDHLEGNAGNDTVYAGSGNDLVLGGSRVPAANVNAADGDDLLDGEAGTDLVIGDNAFGNAPTGFGGGNDTLLGGTENDTVYGGIGNDNLDGEAGDDYLGGLWGNDSIDGGDGNDRLYGYTGDDTLVGGFGIDSLYGGDGDDQLVGGTRLDDEFDASADALFGEDGNDLMLGDNLAFVSGSVGGADSMDGGSGDDTMYGQAANDTLLGGTDDDYLSGGDGNDSLRGNAGNDEMNGDSGNDRMNGDADSDTMTGGLDDDLVRGGTGNDVLDGGDGNDVVLGDSGRDALAGGNGRDVLIGGVGQDGLAGAAGDDLLIGGRTSFDATDGALNRIRAEWTSARTYAQRVANLRGINNPTFAARLNGSVFLKRGGTVFADGNADALNGQADQDWFFRDPGDGADNGVTELVL